MSFTLFYKPQLWQIVAITILIIFESNPSVIFWYSVKQEISVKKLSFNKKVAPQVYVIEAFYSTLDPYL